LLSLLFVFLSIFLLSLLFVFSSIFLLSLLFVNETSNITDFTVRLTGHIRVISNI
jgi:hypothetical protein